MNCMIWTSENFTIETVSKEILDIFKKFSGSLADQSVFYYLPAQGFLVKTRKSKLNDLINNNLELYVISFETNTGMDNKRNYININCNESEVTRISQNDLYEILTTLLNNGELTKDFLSRTPNLTVFLSDSQIQRLTT